MSGAGVSVPTPVPSVGMAGVGQGQVPAPLPGPVARAVWDRPPPGPRDRARWLGATFIPLPQPAYFAGRSPTNPVVIPGLPPHIDSQPLSRRELASKMANPL